MKYVIIFIISCTLILSSILPASSQVSDTDSLCKKHVANVTLAATKPRFFPGDVITINGVGTPDEHVEIKIQDPLHRKVFANVINPDSSGNFLIEFPLEHNSMKGMWSVFVTQSDQLDVIHVLVGTNAGAKITATPYKMNYSVEKDKKASFMITGNSFQTVNVVILDPSDKEKLTDSVNLDSTGICDYPLDLTGYKSGVYTVNASDGSDDASHNFTVGLSSPSRGIVSISTSADSYLSGDKVFVFGDTAPHVDLSVELLDYSGKVIAHLSVTSDKNGMFSTSFHLPPDAKNGTWKVRATSGANFDSAEFEVIEKTNFDSDKIMLTPFDLYFKEDDFTAQGPNHNILKLDKGESATLNIYIKNNDDVSHQITMNDSRGVGVSGAFESFSFEPEQLTVLPHQTNSTKLHLTVSKDTDTHSKFVTFLAQSDSFGMRGIGFFIVVDSEIGELVDHSMRAGMPGAAFGNLNTDISEIDAEKLIDSGFGTPRYLPSGYEFQGMDGSEGHQRFLYSPAPVITESTGFSEFWNDGGLLVLYGIDGPNVNNTDSLPFRVAQDEGQQIMINGMMGDAVEKQTRKVAYSDSTYDFPASISFFDDATKRSVFLRASMPLDEILKIAASIPVYDKPYFAVEENTVQQQGQADDPPPRLLDIAPIKQQFKSGVAIEEIQCRESLVLVTKHDGSTACV